MLLVGALPRRCPAAPPAGDLQARRHAAELFKRGKVLYAAGEYEAALMAFRSGFEGYPLRGFLVNIGQCHRRLGQLDEAAEAYRQFLAGPEVAPALRAEVNEALAEVERVRSAAAPVEPEPVEATPALGPDDERASRSEEVPPGAQLAAAPLEVERRSEAPARRRMRPWMWALIGVGAAGLVVGVTVGAVLGSRAADPGAGSLGLLDGRTR